MPYVVQQVNHLYRDENKSEVDEIAEWLNAQEQAGYRLVGVLGDHRIWDDNGDPAGIVGEMLIVHKD